MRLITVKDFLTARPILVLALALAFVVPQVSAAHVINPVGGTCPAGHNPTSVPGDPGAIQCVHAAASTGADQNPSGTPAPQATETETAPATEEGGSTESAQGFQEFLGPVITPITGLAYVFFAFSNFLLFIVGALFNWVFSETVLQFATTFGNSPGVLAAWSILRDLGNIFLLFGFVFIGLSTILGIQTYAARKTLPRLIIFAVLLNFSLFAAEVVIDTSNALASGIYNQMGVADMCTSGTSPEACSKNVGISGRIFNASGLAAVRAPAFIQEGVTANPATWGRVFTSFSLSHQLALIQTLLGLTLFSTITTIVFGAAAVLLVIRGVVLSLIMVTAPIGFAGMVVPFLGKLAKDWWHNLINQSFFAPAFVLLVFVGLTVAQGTGLGGNTLVQALESGDVSTMQAVAMFALVIGFMLAALLVAKKFGAYGADFAVNSAATATFTGMSFLTGAAARGGRYGLQRFGPQRGWLGAANRAIVNRALRPTEQGIIDMRNIPGAKGILGMAGITKGAEALKGFGSYREIMERPGLITQSKELTKKYQSEIAQAEMVDRAAGGNMRPEDHQTLSRMDKGSLEKLGSRTETLAPHMSAQQFDDMMGSDKLSDIQKERLRDRRLERLLTEVRSGNKDAVRRWSPGELAELGRSKNPDLRNLLTDQNFVKLISDGQADALKTSNKLLEQQRDAFQRSRDDRFSVGNAAGTIREMSPSEVAALHPKFIGQQHVMNAMSAEQVAAIDPNSLDQPTFQTLRNHVQANPNVNNRIQTLINLNPAVAERWGGFI